MHQYYILKGKQALLCKSIMEWAEWFETANRHVADDVICGIRVSTVFLGLDHNFFGKGDPLLFESMVFCPDGTSSDMLRYFTWEEAEAGHKELVKIVQDQADKAGKIGEVAIQKIKLKIAVK